MDTKKVEVTSGNIVGRIHGPKPVSEGGMKTLEFALEYALIKQGHISEEDGTRILQILRTNPSTQLAVLGKRMAQIKKMVEELGAAKTWCERLVEDSAESLEEIRKIAAFNPNWNTEEEE
tara:strand:+ start:858 stop:1217 length:360 start_codon:yes stop_codon:yes gene_type:complete